VLPGNKEPFFTNFSNYFHNMYFSYLLAPLAGRQACQQASRTLAGSFLAGSVGVGKSHSLVHCTPPSFKLPQPALLLLQVRFTGVSAGLFGAVVDIRCSVIAAVSGTTASQWSTVTHQQPAEACSTFLARCMQQHRVNFQRCFVLIVVCFLVRLQAKFVAAAGAARRARSTRCVSAARQTTSREVLAGMTP
jgi:hypothetical protein